jgi:23S rRNA G2069 N7-methylase RlmK/C1962 C5-methylase RlmI
MGGFSDTFSYAVSKTARGDGAAPAAPVLKDQRVKRALNWAPAEGVRYYRVQLSRAKDFSGTALDVFTDTCSLRLAGLPLKREVPYLMRAAASDGVTAGGWSQPAEVIIEPK